MIAVAMGDEDVRDALARECAFQRRDMLAEIGSGIDHRDVLAADDVDAGALEGEGSRIVGDDAADQGRDGDKLAIVRLEFLDEGDGYQLSLSLSVGARACNRSCRSIERGCERCKMRAIFVGARCAKCSSI